MQPSAPSSSTTSLLLAWQALLSVCKSFWCPGPSLESLQNAGETLSLGSNARAYFSHTLEDRL